MDLADLKYQTDLIICNRLTIENLAIKIVEFLKYQDYTPDECVCALALTKLNFESIIKYRVNAKMDKADTTMSWEVLPYD